MNETFTSLLPNSSTPLERCIEEVLYNRMSALTVDLPSTWTLHPNTKEENKDKILTFLAWGLGVEIWGDISNEEKAKLIEEYIYIRKIRGTRGAIERACKILGFTVDITENPPGEDPYSFKVNITGEIVDKNHEISLKRLIEKLKPVHAIYALNVKSNFTGNAGCFVSFRITAINRMSLEL